MSKMALLVLANSNINILNQTLAKMNSKYIDVYIHLDSKQDHIKEEILITNRTKFIENPRNVSWGGYSMVQAMLDLFKLSYSSGEKYSHFCLISDSCYPVYSVDEILKRIEEGVSYINIGDASVGKDHQFYDRYFKYWLMDIPAGNPKGSSPDSNKKYLADFLDSLEDRAGVPDYEFKVGSQWMCLSFEVVRCLTEEMDDDLIKYFKYTMVPDECLIQTFLYKKITENELVGSEFKNNLHFVDFSNQGRIPGFPRVMDETDYNRLLDSGKLFVRKMDSAISLKLIDRIEGGH